MFLRARETFGSTVFRKIIIMAMWVLRTHRDNIIFYGGSLCFASCRHCFVEGIQAITVRVKLQIKGKNNVWLSSLL
ncbi:hypothetical protein HU200_000583 [Digitaria exilis]|uniref:Uncharacterized protein n=1 Tax=Digitaria exilis TaxID=1010633 RepID=A0A835G207_9POAL|nr:hypothetical protein HU200_000594 [Digitaria exilis]KAF8781320.1 hypothetical protein HU200_000583 [Digitaria exilis]